MINIKLDDIDIILLFISTELEDTTLQILHEELLSYSHNTGLHEPTIFPRQATMGYWI